MRIFIFIMSSLFILPSCRQDYFRLTGSNASLSNAMLVNGIRTNIDKKPDQNFLLKEIVWSNECRCGLYDFTRVKKGSYNYFPILVDSSSVYWLMEDSLKLRIDSDVLISQFMNRNEIFFTSEEIDLMRKRLSKGVIKIRGSLMMSDIDFEADSLILYKHLNKSEKTIRVKFR